MPMLSRQVKAEQSNQERSRSTPSTSAKHFSVREPLGWRRRSRDPISTRFSYAIERYVKETNRLYAVLNKRLADREFLAGNYSIADMASYPWVVPHTRQGQNLDDFPHLKRWFETIRARPATARAYALAQEVNTQPTVTEEAKRVLFGQTAAVVDA